MFMHGRLVTVLIVKENLDVVMLQSENAFMFIV